MHQRHPKKYGEGIDDLFCHMNNNTWLDGGVKFWPVVAK